MSISLRSCAVRSVSAGGAANNWLSGTPFESNGSSSPWQQTAIGPGAVYDATNGKVWFAWERGIGTSKRVVSIATYHPADTTWSENYVAGTNTLISDVHGTPSIAKDNSGYFYLFYGSHSSAIKVAATANANDPSIWFDQPDISGTHTFPNAIGDSSNIYLLDNIPSTAVGGGPQAAVEMLVGTPSAGTISWAGSKTLIDGGDGTHLGWIPVCQARESLDGLEIHFVFPYAITIAEKCTGIYYARYVKSTGALKNYDGTHSVTSPVNFSDMNTYYKIASTTDAGLPALAIDASGASHVTYADGSSNTNAVLYHITASGGAWSAAHTVFTYPSAVNPLNVDSGIVPNSASGVDIYYPDGSAGYTFPGSGQAAAGSVFKVTRSSGGAWSGPNKVLQMGIQGLDYPAPVLGGTSAARVVVTEVTSDYTTMSGALNGYALNDNGIITRPAIVNSSAATSFLNRTTGGLNATHTAAYTELINGLVTDGTFTLLDALHILATQDSTTALLNLCSSSYPITVVGSPIFTADSGYAGPPWDNSNYLNPNFNPATASSPNYTQNSASLGAWTFSNAQGGATIAVNTASTNVTYIFPRYSDDHSYVNVNTGSDVDPGAATSDSSGLASASRRAASGYSHYKNGVNVGNVTAASSAVVNGAITIGGGHSNALSWNTGNIAASFIAGGLTDNQMRTLYRRLYIYMVTIAGIS